MRGYANFLDDRVRSIYWDKVQPCPMSGCWIWTAATARGYGRIGSQIGSGRYGRRVIVRMAHRIFFESLVGKVPGGLDIDHLCRNTLCVNPAHLDPVTRQVNTVRGISQPAINARKTHCSNGHAYDEENTYTYVGPEEGRSYGRSCRTCGAHRRRKKLGWTPEEIGARPVRTIKRSPKRKVQS